MQRLPQLEIVNIVNGEYWHKGPLGNGKVCRKLVSRDTRALFCANMSCAFDLSVNTFPRLEEPGPFTKTVSGYNEYDNINYSMYGRCAHCTLMHSALIKIGRNFCIATAKNKKENCGPRNLRHGLRLSPCQATDTDGFSEWENIIAARKR